MPIVTLTTDWNSDDYYTGAIKGTLYSKCENVTVVDISHKVKPFNIFQAAFILKNSFLFFPKGTIHIIAVKSDKTAEQKYITAEFDGHYFIGADNGIFSLLFKDDAEVNYYSIDETHETSFPTLDIFTKIACSIAKGSRIESLGAKVDNIYRRVPLRATIDENVIIGSIVHIDSYQNAITNVSRDLFDRVGKGRSFKIFVQSNHYVISRINKSYQETSGGELLAIFNSLNLLEIAINGGNAAELLNLNTDSSIRIKFQ